MLEIIATLIAAQLHIAGLQAQNTALMAENAALEAAPPKIEYVTEYVTEYVPVETVRTEYVETPTQHECGVCGAHVTEWWQVRNDADTAFVDVCELCYRRIAADDYYWPEGV